MRIEAGPAGICSLFEGHKRAHKIQAL